ncbi:MAG: hypothetical protein KJ936_10795 [Proteobacteria bacterium]|nr:hypothetical protein [Pseudomonadota bacterium]MBU2228131.1 hypothetical protein [Pseudomonadota bacterium]MBU2262452.1 hypothetical protein [Pseudomonadota bacterium]
MAVLVVKEILATAENLGAPIKPLSIVVQMGKIYVPLSLKWGKVVTEGNIMAEA